MSQIANIVDWYVMPSISVRIVAERFSTAILEPADR